MKVLLLTLLFLLLSFRVFSLICYTCEGGSDCKTETNCTSDEYFCQTYEEGDLFNRTCVEFCAEDDFTHCCQEDLCGP